jgi:hypothetical protein
MSLSNGFPFFFAFSFGNIVAFSGNTSGALTTALQNPPYGAPYHAAKVRRRDMTNHFWSPDYSRRPHTTQLDFGSGG